jgi:transposase-like protein
MKRLRFTEDQIIGILREQDAGPKVVDLARKHGISEATLSNWKAKYGGLDVSEAKRLKALEDENVKLKKILADQMLEPAALRELPSKNDRARRSARSSREPSDSYGSIGASSLSDCCR